MSKGTVCHLREPDGTAITRAVAELDSSAPRAQIIALDRPGRLVQRCVLGGLRQVRVDLGEGTPVPAEVERVYFDPGAGRCCTVRLHDAAALGA